MTVTIDGTNGVTTPDVEVSSGGSASTPAITVSGDTNTGIFFPAADSIAFAEGGAEAMRINSSGNVGIGTDSPNSRLMLQTPNGTACQLNLSQTDVTNYRLSIPASTDALTFVYGASTESARITSNGSFLFGTTSSPVSSGGGSAFINDGESRWQLIQNHSTTDARALQSFRNPNGSVGSITTSGSSTAFNTSSDYRLKNTIAPMTGALAKVALLKPCTYKWNCDGSDGQGFIAHELQDVVPDAVTGEKDAIETYLDEDDVEQTRPVYQGVDTSFLVATLTAAIQELKAINDAQASRIETLEAKVAALEAN